MYTFQPNVFEKQDPSLVCKLHKALYRLKQDPRVRYENLTRAIVNFGFTHGNCDHSLFIYSHQCVTLYALVYVDDIIIIIFSSTLVHKLIDSQPETFALKKLDIPEEFLLLTHTKYIRDLILIANMCNVNGVTTPMLKNCKLSKHGSSSLSLSLSLILNYIVPW